MQPVRTNQTAILYELPGVCLTLADISSATGLDHHKISVAAGKLIKKGLVERAEVGCFRLTPAGQQAVDDQMVITSGPNAPLEEPRASLANTFRQRAWNAMRIQRSFTIGDLVTSACTGEERDPENNLQRYCRALSRAGVLRKMRRKVTGTRIGSNGFARYQLLKDLGPIAPSIRHHVPAIHDHNRAEDMAYVS